MIKSKYLANEKTKKDITTLYNVLAYGISGFYIILIKILVSINIRGYWGNALLTASKKDHVIIEQFLLNNNANFNLNSKKYSFTLPVTSVYRHKYIL